MFMLRSLQCAHIVTQLLSSLHSKLQKSLIWTSIPYQILIKKKHETEFKDSFHFGHSRPEKVTSFSQYGFVVNRLPNKTHPGSKAPPYFSVPFSPVWPGIPVKVFRSSALQENSPVDSERLLSKHCQLLVALQVCNLSQGAYTGLRMHTYAQLNADPSRNT